MIKIKKSLENIIPYEIDKYRQEWRLKLDSNENVYGCNSVIMSAIKNTNTEDVSLYPVYGKFLDKLAQKFELKSYNFLITNGCDEALSIVINTYLDDNDELLTYNPTFSMPILYAKQNGANISQINYKENFEFDYEHLKENINEKTKVVYLASPNNPTGEIIKPAYIKMLSNEFKDVLFILDCTYINYSYQVDLNDYVDLVKTNSNIVVVKSFSKDFAIAGLRLGFVVADNEIIDSLKKVASPYNVNIIALNCGIAALNNEKLFDEVKELNKEAKELLYNGLLEKGFKLYKSEANFILCDFGPYCDFYFEKLKNNGVLVRNFSANSPIASCLRITIPKIGGVKYILEILNKKDVLIFDIKNIIDCQEVEDKIFEEIFKRFSGMKISSIGVNEAKIFQKTEYVPKILKYLLEKENILVNYDDIVKDYETMLHLYLNEENLLISKDLLEDLSKKYDLVLYSNRMKNETISSLKQFNVENYFYYMFCEEYNNESLNVMAEIVKHSPNITIKSLTGSVVNLIKNKECGIETIGIISAKENFNQIMNNFKHIGVQYIIDDVNNVQEILGEIDTNYAKN